LIDFTEIPDWVRWVAQDADGCWWGYSVEPNLSHQGWYENEVGESVRLDKAEPNQAWAHTLRRVK
jgi:hypothetical protein